ncbi:MAG: ABC transporter permease subunit [Proteobacteria bacterium]|nr:ABC transporter permease subunit [Pseudomonadota bacterium]
MDKARIETFAQPSTKFKIDKFIVIVVTVCIAAALMFFMLFPLGSILWRSFIKEGSFTLENYVKYFQNPRISRSLYNSFYVSTITMAITTILAFFYAYALQRTTIRGKGFFYVVAFMPLIAPSIMQALALIFLFGRNGLITAHLLKISWSIYGATGIIASEVLYCFPHAVVILYTTLSAVDTRLDEAAQSLGASSLKVFWKVTVPAAKYGLVSAAALTFNLTITDFGNPVVIGGDYNVLATEIYSQVTNLFRFDLGATISVILLVPSVCAFLINYYITKRSFALISGAARPFLQPSRTFKKWGFTIYCGLVTFAILLVFATVILGSFVKVWPYDWTLTLKHFRFPSLGGYASIWTSFKISLAVGLLGAFFTLIAGYIVEKKRPFGVEFLYLLSVMPAAIPGLVMGLGYILAFNYPIFFFYGTSTIIVICVVVSNFTLGTLSSVANLKNIDPSVEEAAISLGADSVRTFIRVIFPLSMVAFVQNFIYFFMRAMTTISAVIFLVSATVHLAAIEIIQLDNDGWTASANAMTTCIIAIVVAMLVVLRLLAGNKGFAGFGGATSTPSG